MKNVKILTNKEVDSKINKKFDESKELLDKVYSRLLKLEEEVKILNIVIDKMR